MKSDADEYECEYEDDVPSPRHEQQTEQDGAHLVANEHEDELDEADPIAGEEAIDRGSQMTGSSEEELEDDRVDVDMATAELEDERVEDALLATDEEVLATEQVCTQIQGKESPSRIRSVPTKSAYVQQQQQLQRKLKNYQKRNAELHHQLQLLYKNDAIAQLENKAKEKQLQMEQVMQENRLLLYQQRLLAKQIEELQGSKEDLPRKLSTMIEELRAYKDRVRQYKEQLKLSEEKASRAHQQAVDLAAKNKELVDKLRQREGATNPLSPCGTMASLHSFGVASPRDGDTIIASQEDEITKLQHRVVLMKKVQHSDRIKYERLVKSSEEQVEQTRQQLDALFLQMSAKEKAMRTQFLVIKGLKRSLHEISLAQQSNAYMQQFLFGRDGRIAAAIHHHNSQSTHHHHLHLHNHSSHVKMPMPRKATNKRIQDTLWKLGFLPSHSSPPRHTVEIDQHDEERWQSSEPLFSRQVDDSYASETATPTRPRPPDAARKMLAPGSSRTQFFGQGPSGRLNARVATVHSAQNPPMATVPLRDSRPTSVEPNIRGDVDFEGRTTAQDSREDDADR